MRPVVTWYATPASTMDFTNIPKSPWVAEFCKRMHTAL